MEVTVVHSKNNILRFAVKNLKEKAPENFNFAIFSISPEYPCKDFPAVVKRYFGNINYIGFQSVSAFENCRLVEDGVVGVFFQFQSDKTSVETFVRGNISLKNFKEVEKEILDFLEKEGADAYLVLADYCEGFFPLLLEDAVPASSKSKGKKPSQ